MRGANRNHDSGNLPTVSVVIPCYNVEPYVRSSLQSVLNQTYSPQRIICIDDGSTDATVSILKSMQAEGANFMLRTQRNRGASAARNVGLALCDTAFVQFLDADDLLYPSKLAHQAQLAARGSSPPDLIAGSYYSVDVAHPERQPSTVTLHHDDWTGLIITRLGITSSNLYRTASVKELGGWNEDYGPSDDAELAFRLLKSGGKVLRDHQALTMLRRRSDSLWNRDTAQSLQAWIRLRKEIYSCLDDSNLLTPAREKVLLHRLFMALRDLYRRDSRTAVRLHRDAIPSTYHHEDSGRVYSLLYRVFGFEIAEVVHRYWLSVRPFIF